MNRIRRYYKPFLDQKRVSLRTSSMARRRAITSLNKVGEAYGVVVNRNGSVSRRPIGTASVKRRKLKHKFLNNDKKEMDLKEIFKSNRFITTSKQKESSDSTTKDILKSSSQPNIRSVCTIPSNMKSTKKIRINPKLNVETTCTTNSKTGTQQNPPNMSNKEQKSLNSSSESPHQSKPVKSSPLTKLKNFMKIRS